MTTEQRLVEQITKIAQSDSWFSQEHEARVKTELEKAYRGYAAERGFNTAFKVKGIRDGFFDLTPSSYRIVECTQCGDQHQHDLTIWVSLKKVQIDIKNKTGEKTAESLSKAIKEKGIKVIIVTMEAHDRAIQSYLDASSEIGIH